MHIDPSTIRIPWDIGITLRGQTVQLLSPVQVVEREPPDGASPIAVARAFAASVLPETHRAMAETFTSGELGMLQAVYQGACALYWGAFNLAVQERLKPAAARMVAASGYSPPDSPEAPAPARDSTAPRTPVEARSKAAPADDSMPNRFRFKPGGGPLPALLGGEPWGAARPEGAEPSEIRVGVGRAEPQEVAASA